MDHSITSLPRFGALLMALAFGGCAADLDGPAPDGEGAFALDAPSHFAGEGQAPATNEPGTNEPATNEPATNEPATNGSAVTEHRAAELVATLMEPAVEVFIDPSTYSPGRSSVLAFTTDGRDVLFEIEADSEHEAHELAQAPLVIELGSVHTWTGRADGDELMELPADPAALFGHLAEGASTICDQRLLKATAFVHSPIAGPHDRTIGVIALLEDADEPQDPDNPEEPEELEQPKPKTLQEVVDHWVATREQGCSLPDGINCSQGNLCVYMDYWHEDGPTLMQNICAPVVLGCLCPSTGATKSRIQPPEDD